LRCGGCVARSGMRAPTRTAARVLCVLRPGGVGGTDFFLGRRLGGEAQLEEHVVDRPHTAFAPAPAHSLRTCARTQPSHLRPHTAFAPAPAHSLRICARTRRCTRKRACVRACVRASPRLLAGARMRPAVAAEYRCVLPSTFDYCRVPLRRPSTVDYSRIPLSTAEYCRVRLSTRRVSGC
jgi:hypothetical protein